MYDYGGGSIAGRLFEQAGVPLAALTGPANLLLEAIGGVHNACAGTRTSPIVSCSTRYLSSPITHTSINTK
jgi:hypothetical protein